MSVWDRAIEAVDGQLIALHKQDYSPEAADLQEVWMRTRARLCELRDRYMPKPTPMIQTGKIY